MTGALLNLVSYGNINIVVNGNPNKNLFYKKWFKYTNFGQEKIRLNPLGTNFFLNERSITKLRFRIDRSYGDLLKELFFVITIPNIWSPVNIPNWTPDNNGNINCQPYEFRWIENLGCQLINMVTLSYGNNIIQQFSGTYLQNKVKRDFSAEKLKLFNEMTGNVKEINDPANAFGRGGRYPSSLKLSTEATMPSIFGRELIIPLHFWFMSAISEALPLCAINYNEIFIDLEIKPIRELFVVRDQIFYMRKKWDILNGELSPNPNYSYSYFNSPHISTMDRISPYYQMYLFLTQINHDFLYNWGLGNQLNNPDQPSNWNPDPHLIGTYIVLEDKERKVFQTNKQSYVFKIINEIDFLASNFASKRTLKLKANGLVANLMWFLRRDDVKLRNEWSNYTNWEYKSHQPYLPRELNTSDIQLNELCKPYYRLDMKSSGNLSKFITSNGINLLQMYRNSNTSASESGRVDASNQSRPFFIAPPLVAGVNRKANQRNILLKWSITLDGNIRENTLDSILLEKNEFYNFSNGKGEEGLYFYNFGLKSDDTDIQPNGMLNLNSFNYIFFNIETIDPPLNRESLQYPVCHLDDTLISINKSDWEVFKFGYDYYLMMECYNILEIENGLMSYIFNNQ